MPKQRRRFDPDEIFQPGTQIPVVDYMARQGPPTTALSVAGMENAGVLAGMRQERVAPPPPAVMTPVPPAGGMDRMDGQAGIPAGMPAAGGSVVDELLRGGRRGAGPAAAVPGMAPVRPTESAAAGPVAPSGWSGTMRPIRLAPGESLLERPRGYTGREGDAGVLGARAEQFDRNFANYLRAGGWRSREEFERGAAALPGAGEEILGHVQARVAEAMPASMREELALEQVNRQALRREAAEGVMQEARLARYLEGASPEEVAAFHKNYQPVPGGGFRKITQPGNAISDEEYREWAVRVSPEEKAEFLKNYVNTPAGWKSKRGGGLSEEELIAMWRGGETPPPSAPKQDERNWFQRTFLPPGAETQGTNGTYGAAAPGAGAEEVFENEAAARAAGKKTGDIIVVGGKRWRLD